MEFKLLALKLNKKSSYTKNLKEGVLYQFTQEFKFIYDSDKKRKVKSGHSNLIAIEQLNTYPHDLYDFINLKSTHQVNITAILGKNGAGKSTLLELLYLLIYCLSERKQLLSDRDTNAKLIERNQFVDYHKQLNKKIDDILEESQMELYYKFDNDFYLASNSGKQINFYVLNDKKWEVKEFDRSKFFYTICVNYSLHGLNSSGNYFWLNGLFHKNDGYKTPLVITPWREQGNMNINTELHLAQTRILANLISESFESQNIIDDKVIAAVEFKVVPDSIGRINAFSLSFIYNNTKKINGVDLIDLFEKIIISYDPSVKPKLDEVLKFLKEDLIKNDKDSVVAMNEFSFDNQRPVDRQLIRCLLAKYIITKIVKICMKYSEFRQFTGFWSFEENSVANVLLINKVEKLPQKLKADQTHVTLKLKQAINAFLFDYLDENSWVKERNPENLERVIYITSLDFTNIQVMIKSAFERSKQKKKSVAQFIPTGFFLPTIFVKNNSGNFPFGQLSSGEQQMVHSIHSILYHIINLDSLAESKEPYKAVNLVLDEIELYYHPEFQRLFVNKLLDSLSRLKLKCISGFNIIFSTHSPFILSDIPHRNVLKLKDGNPVTFDDEARTFGSNIHEMLTDSFFLDQNLIGAFAERKIQNCLKKLRLLELGRERVSLQNSNIIDDKGIVISRINEEINKLVGKKTKFDYGNEHALEVETQKILKTINMIGEPVVKYKLLEMYDEILAIEDREKAKAKRDIQEIMERSGIKKEEI
ncbi:MAG: AAA family ATPase [Bacteroidota bacterium]